MWEKERKTHVFVQGGLSLPSHITVYFPGARILYLNFKKNRYGICLSEKTPHARGGGGVCEKFKEIRGKETKNPLV